MPRVSLLLVLLLLGPKEAIAGKFPGHAPEYLERYPAPPAPLPDPLPEDVDALAGLVGAGHGTAEVFEALGDRLLARGDGALAYRAYRKAQSLADAASRPERRGPARPCALLRAVRPRGG
jgi:hypothetical protein